MYCRLLFHSYFNPLFKVSARKPMVRTITYSTFHASFIKVSTDLSANAMDLSKGSFNIVLIYYWMSEIKWKLQISWQKGNKIFDFSIHNKISKSIKGMSFKCFINFMNLKVDLNKGKSRLKFSAIECKVIIHIFLLLP